MENSATYSCLLCPGFSTKHQQRALAHTQTTHRHFERHWEFIMVVEGHPIGCDCERSSSSG